MLDRFIYEDHLGRRFVGLDNGVYLNYSDLRDYSWSYDTINSRISRFFRPITERKLPLVIVCADEVEANAVKNRLLELTETDIEAKTPGKIYVGDCYTNGYITASVKSEYLIAKRYCKVELKLTSDDPTWYREQLHVFNQNQIGTIGMGIDYPFDYPHDYSVSMKGRNILCDSVRGSAFRLKIYGEAENPVVNVGGNIYKINGSVGLGESLLIDSLTKTITLTTSTGKKINWFDKRSRESYIFEPIPAGLNAVSWGGSFAFDLTVIEKRSEPRWT